MTRGDSQAEHFSPLTRAPDHAVNRNADIEAATPAAVVTPIEGRTRKHHDKEDALSWEEKYFK